MALRGDPGHPFTRGALCGKVNRYLDAVTGPDRLTTPLVRVGPKGVGPVSYRPASWDEAVRRVAGGLRASIDINGPESVLPYYFAGTMGLVQGWTMGPRLFAHLGASRLRTTICTAASRAALGSVYGGSVGFEPESVVEAKLIVLWGANLLSTNLHHWPFVRQAQQRGAYVVTIDPLRTDTAARSDAHVAPLPGTDAALALGLMRHVRDLGGVDRPWLAATPSAGSGWRPAWTSGRWTAPPPSAASTSTWYAASASGSPPPGPPPSGSGSACNGTPGPGRRSGPSRRSPLVTGDFRYPGGGALATTSGHHRIDSDRVARPAGMPAPPARSINMSRLAAALTGKAQLHGHRVGGLRHQPGRLPPGPPGSNHRRPVPGGTVGVARAPAASPTWCCRPPCSPNTSTCTPPTVTTTPP